MENRHINKEKILIKKQKKILISINFMKTENYNISPHFLNSVFGKIGCLETVAKKAGLPVEEKQRTARE